jgi:type III secretion system-like peptide-binding chaperone
MAMFETDAQREVYDKVGRYLQELFGDLAEASEENPVFWVPHGSTAALVSVLPWGEDDATISVRAYVLFHAQIGEGLMYFLLRQNDDCLFGAFGLDADDDVFFEHSIVGSTCERDELLASVTAVSTTADEYDDVIQERWGGERTSDHLRSKFW